jgi:uncharacterized membrane protein YbhN (UPF0104 family)
VSRRTWAAVRVLGGLAVVAVLLARLGTGPFVDGVRLVDAEAIAAATVILALTTVCNAWRWRLVARGLGVAMPLGTAIAASYRAQFLNPTLPGGVLGDVHRGVTHGRAAGDLGRGIRAVAWERAAGQLVQLAVALAVLLVLPSPVPSLVPLVLVLVVVVVAGGCTAMLRPGAGTAVWRRALAAASADVRDGILARHALPGVLVTSVLAVAGYAVTFLVAARTAGSTSSLVTLLPLAMVVLVAMAVPVNIAGWGPREGAAAWAFGAAGLGAAQGMTVAVVFGVMVMVACLPGAVVLVAQWLLAGRGRVAAETAASPELTEQVGARHG